MSVVSSKVEICNFALGMVGEKVINSLDEDSTEARACNQFFDIARDTTLRSHLWNFALKRAVLSASATAPLFGYEKSYPLPTDFLRLAEFNDLAESQFKDDCPHAIEGRDLLTDETEVKIRYVRQETDVTLYDALFVEALAVKLAALVTPRVNDDWSMAGQFLQQFEGLILTRARRIDATEDKNRKRSPARRSRFAQSRFGRVRR